MADYVLTEHVTIALDRPRHLRLEIWDVMDAERKMCQVWGKQVNILTIFADTLTLNDLSILLWAALKWDDPLLSLEQAQRLITLENLGDIMAAVMEAWNRGMQSAQPAANDEGTVSPFPSVSLGSVSGPTPVLS